MKKLLLFIFIFLWLVIFAFAQPASNKKPVPAVITAARTAGATQTHEKRGIRIAPALQADIKQLEDTMKPYEEVWKEYNRLAGLKSHVYEVLIKAEGIDMKELVAQPQITADSIKLLIKKTP